MRAGRVARQEAWGQGRYREVDLSPYLNHSCASFDQDTFASLGFCSFPAEELAALPRPFIADGVPLRLPPFLPGRPDNLMCEGQKVGVPPGRYCALALLGVAEMGSYVEEMRLRFEGGAEQARELALTRWTDRRPRFGEAQAYTVTHVHGPGTQVVGQQASLWLKLLVVDPARRLRAVVFPNNIFLHFLALTLIVPPRAPGPCPSRCPGRASPEVTPCPART
ncbi:MAG: hypothetical protein K6T75_01000 [Acetobacteraceae bacterium]|nr:hypothetical protein [Acetobacteraceae bacterium]